MKETMLNEYDLQNAPGEDGLLDDMDTPEDYTLLDKTKLHNMGERLNAIYGEPGTPSRDAFTAEAIKAINS